MPEGPEIRRAADRIEAVLKSQRVEKIVFGLPRLEQYESVFTDTRVLGIETRGKALLTHFDNDLSIYSHNQLYGVWRIVRRDQFPNTRRQLRLAIHTHQHSALLYSASDISVWERHRIEEHPFLSRIGPDILHPNLQWRDVAERLSSPRFRNRALSSVYLDQAFLAGLGNYLRSEILFSSGVHPSKKARELTRGQVGKLARATLTVAQQSYVTGGVIVSDRDYKASRAKGVTHGQSRFFVFARASKPCRVCKTKIQRSSANSRRIYICPTCQPV
jgi:endonuclease-8